MLLLLIYKHDMYLNSLPTLLMRYRTQLYMITPIRDYILNAEGSSEDFLDIVNEEFEIITDVCNIIIYSDHHTIIEYPYIIYIYSYIICTTFYVVVIVIFTLIIINM